jgi:hypothetical protein
MLMCFSFRLGTGVITESAANADGVVVIAIIPNVPTASAAAAKIADTAATFVMLFFIFSKDEIIYIFELRKLILVCYCRFI